MTWEQRVTQARRWLAYGLPQSRVREKHGGCVLEYALEFPELPVIEKRAKCWICQACEHRNLEARERCWKCKTRRPNEIPVHKQQAKRKKAVAMKPGLTETKRETVIEHRDVLPPSGAPTVNPEQIDQYAKEAGVRKNSRRRPPW